MQSFKVFHAILILIFSEMKGMKALSTNTGMSILKKNGVEANFTSNLVCNNFVPIKAYMWCCELSLWLTRQVGPP